MAEVTIYTTPICPYCDRVKALLKHKGVAYTEVDVSANSALRHEMIQRSGGLRTVPQIFIGQKHIGGSDTLHLLEQEGKLDTLLQ